jgi:phytoene synthase
MIDARVHDLYDDPLADMSALLAYACATGGDLTVQASRILCGIPDAGVGAAAEAEAAAVARDVGTAWALTGLLTTLGQQAGAGRCYLPADRLAAEGVQMADFLACRPSAGLARVVAVVAAEARRLLASARSHRRDLPKAALPAVLMAPLIDRYLARLARNGADPFHPVELPPWQTPALIGLAALRGRF